MIIGTAAYMSPEQAAARGVDKRRPTSGRSGACSSRCLLAAALFGEDSVSETLSAVLVREPDWSALPR